MNAHKMQHHLWLANLDDETVAVFATAYTLSAKKRGGRISTERFLAALPDARKDQMARLCRDAQNECKMCVSAGDLPAPTLPDDWQELVTFSTCIESTLFKCAPRTDLVTFCKLLCKTAVRLHCICDRNIDVDAYLTSDTMPSRDTDPTPQTRASVAASESFCVGDALPEDVIQLALSKARGVEALRTCKAVCKAWQQAGRLTLCNVDWLVAQPIGLHGLLKKGRPSPALVLALAARRPECMHERDGEGLLPLQYAAAYRMDAALLAVLRNATVSMVPGSCAWANSDEARAIKSQLRPVSTRVARGPIRA